MHYNIYIMRYTFDVYIELMYEFLWKRKKVICTQKGKSNQIKTPAPGYLTDLTAFMKKSYKTSNI